MNTKVKKEKWVLDIESHYKLLKVHMLKRDLKQVELWGNDVKTSGKKTAGFMGCFEDKQMPFGLMKKVLSIWYVSPIIAINLIHNIPVQQKR